MIFTTSLALAAFLMITLGLFIITQSSKAFGGMTLGASLATIGACLVVVLAVCG